MECPRRTRPVLLSVSAANNIQLKPSINGRDRKPFVVNIDECSSAPLETVQDFLIKPIMYLLEISIFSLNNVILRLTKIMNRANKNWAHF